MGNRVKTASSLFDKPCSLKTVVTFSGYDHMIRYAKVMKLPIRQTSSSMKRRSSVMKTVNLQ